jgi:hypothetical protein
VEVDDDGLSGVGFSKIGSGRPVYFTAECVPAAEYRDDPTRRWPSTGERCR